MVDDGGCGMAGAFCREQIFDGTHRGARHQVKLLLHAGSSANPG